MVRTRVKVLCISHQASLNGAPMSLIGLMRYFRGSTDWDLRVLVGRPGPLEAQFAELAPTERFYEHVLYTEERPGELRRGALLVTFLRQLRYGMPLGKAWRFLRHELGERRAALLQIAHERGLRERVRAWAPDLVYSNTAVNGVILRSLGLGAPVAVHVRELHGHLKGLGPTARESLVRDTSLFFAVSQAVRDALMAIFDVPGSRIEIAPVALDTETVLARAEALSPEQVRKDLGVVGEEFVVGGVGHVCPRKGCDLFVKVAESALAHDTSGRQLVFIWVGGGAELDAVKQQARDAGVDGRVRFVGEKQNPFPYIKRFDALLMCSREDPFPRVNLEAGLLCKPVVAFAGSGGSREYVEQDAGMVVEDMDAGAMAAAVNGLAGDPQQCRRYGECGRRKVLERYTISRVGAGVVRRLEELVAAS